MSTLKYRKELYSRTALLKAAYNFTDAAYIHLDADEQYYYVELCPKQPDQLISEQEFTNEMLAQSVRHEVYRQTKKIRELMIARAMSSSLITEERPETEQDAPHQKFSEDAILKDWFEAHESETE